MNKTKPSSPKVNNNILTNERNLGNAFNKYFTSIAHELYSKLPLLDTGSPDAD